MSDLINVINEYIDQANRLVEDDSLRRRASHIYAGDNVIRNLDIDEATDLVDGLDLKISGYANATDPLHISIQDQFDGCIKYVILETRVVNGRFVTCSVI